MPETTAPPQPESAIAAPAASRWEPRPGGQMLLIYIALVVVCLFYSQPARLARTSALLVLLYAIWIKYELGPLVFGRLATTMESEHVATRAEAWAWPAAGVAFFLGALWFLEWRQPYYFTQDDNLAQFLPGILQACRGAMDGVFPTWNPYQYMGSPTTTVGTYALTYPPTYLSYLLARFVFGNEYLTVEIFCIAHLLAAYFVIYRLLRRLDVRPSVATLATLCCVLSGFALLIGRSWFYMTPVFVYTPLLMEQTRRFAHGERGWKWMGMTALWLGAYFHAGNVQMWAYTVLLLGVAFVLLFAARAAPWRAIFAAASALLFGLAISAPLLIPEYLATRNVIRGAIPEGILNGLPTLFVPVSVVQTYHPNKWGAPFLEHIGEMYYSGTIFVVLTLVLCVAMFFSRWRAEAIRQNLWVVPAVVALLLALGHDAWPWRWLAKLPGFSEFRSPLKLVAFIALFTAFAGAVLLERHLRRWRHARRIELALGVLLLAVLAHHVALSKAALFVYGVKPYPTMDARLLSLLKPADGSHPKFFAHAPWRSLNEDYYLSMKHQWPTVAEVFSAHGYDPLIEGDRTFGKLWRQIERSKMPVTETFAQYGIRYVLVYELAEDNRPKWLGLGKMVYQQDKVRLYEVPGALPMAFVEGDTARNVPAKFDAGGVTLMTGGVNGPVILNMLWRKEMRGTEPDALGRVRVPVPPSAASVRVDFSPPWGWGWLAAVGFGVAGVALGFNAEARRRGEG